MNRTIIPILFLALSWPATAATRIEATLTLTNTPGVGALIQANGQARLWTNGTLASTNWLQVSNSPATSATNIYAHVLANPFSNVVQVTWQTSTSLLFSANLDLPLSLIVTGGWATVQHRTNYVQTTGPIVMPMPTNTTELLRTNQATHLMNWLQTNSQVAPAASGAFGRFADTNTAQTLVGKTMQASTYTGTIGALTNGLLTNAVLLSPKSTNAVNYGNAFSSPGTGTASEQFGSGAAASGIASLAVGNGATASGTNSVAIGLSSSASAINAVAYGNSANVSSPNGIAIGSSATVSGSAAMALGSGATVVHDSSIAIGLSVATTRTNEIRLGGSQDVVIGGLLFAEKGATNLALMGITTNTALIKDGTYTNAILQNPIATNLSGSLSGVSATTVAGSAFTLTNVALREVTLGGSNTLAGDLALTARAVSTLADGYNSGVNIGTNYFVRLSGGSAGVTNAGFVAGSRDGEVHLVEITGGTNFVVLNDSGLEGTAGNRIITGTGGALVLTNAPAFLEVIYSTSASRWRVIRASQ